MKLILFSTLIVAGIIAKEQTEITTIENDEELAKSQSNEPIK